MRHPPAAAGAGPAGLRPGGDPESQCPGHRLGHRAAHHRRHGPPLSGRCRVGGHAGPAAEPDPAIRGSPRHGGGTLAPLDGGPG
ncbi:Helix-turn-helix domain, partial [Dysosmobacter welbionis]